MSKSEAVKQIIRILKDVQELSGRKSVEMTGQTRPIGGLPDFDSLNGVEATAMIGSAFGIELSGANILVNDAGDRALSVSQVADLICKLTPR